MRTIALDQSRGAARNLSAATRQGYILLTQRGKPIAYVLPTRFYDEEDIGYMTDPEFWKMVRRWRAQRGPSIPLEEYERQLNERERQERLKTKAGSKNGRKAKRNGTA